MAVVVATTFIMLVASPNIVKIVKLRQTDTIRNL